MSSETKVRGVEWGAWIFFGAGLTILGIGVARYFRQRHFDLTDLLHCALAMVPAFLLVLVADYVLHHARLVVAMVVFIAAVAAYTFPAFNVALGLVLAGMIGSALWNERRESLAVLRGS